MRTRPGKRRLLAGILKCGVCGGPLAAFGTTRGVTYIRCTRATEAGVCGSTKRFRLDSIEKTVLTALMQH
uniref:zinc ribbon domain-containing protein n=2 Tax=Stenotrophomonas maltophilia TaxID=40324 RepID=UPI0019532DE7